VAVVTKPFLFEGKRRMRTAEAGIAELRRHVDTLIVIPNQNLFRIADERTPFAEAFVLADQVLYAGVACIVDLVVRDALINLDLADVRTVLGGMGTAMMGTGEASGENRALTAARDAIFNPLLDDVSLRGARSLLVAIGGGQDLTLFEVHDAVDCVRQELDPEANIIFGATLDDSLTGRIRVSVVASGMHRAEMQAGRGQAASGKGPIGTRASSPVAARTERREEAHPQAADAARHPAPGAHPSAPGDVVIRERPPQLSGEFHGAYGRAERRDDDRLPGRQTSSAVRTRRPMPTVEDFPPVGQREYWAKTAGRAVAPDSRQVDPATRKTGLLQRLTGRGGDRRGDARAPAERPADEPLDLPVFFRRDQGA
jgi:cell division protein FtsZ